MGPGCPSPSPRIPATAPPLPRLRPARTCPRGKGRRRSSVSGSRRGREAEWAAASLGDAMALWWRRCCFSRAPAFGCLRSLLEAAGPRLGSGSRAGWAVGAAEMHYFLGRSSVLSFPKIRSIFLRFHHTTTSRPCSCSKTVTDEKIKDPFKLGRKDLKNLYEDIKKELLVSTAELGEMCEYYFDGKGKAFRPMIVVLMARACNIHHNNSGEVQASQRSVAIIAEMIHTASLVHDDVIDDANSRRGKMTVNQIWGERKAVLAGDFILSAASVALARIGNTTIISVLSQVIEDLVRGEFLQLGSKENENERFAHYLEKTFKKTASLIANSCKAVSILGCPDPKVHEIAYQYGKNVGIAFQLIDDVLDFTSCADQLGKPAAADLKLGLATGPVLFACQQFPEMNAMIMRRFSLPGDVERARQYVLQSDGVQQTTYLAQRYGYEAMKEISKLRPSPERDALIQLTETVLTRDK
ncbi:all trans-polyprenyl-diphosphate synthase PDSS1 isoform X1 [Mauremys reevesii]|uniref:all trans-polyprenyl-diphosphate synthase PDSS1 isoform X1 n=3 Tax=Mauremys reevesii TaxID=260615 RepID=UPI00193F9ED4|nr:all trans-polyprenyl-diphosphate synthase PDSS1 isoform X1 [Mauremys reevesii]